jgi:hypothetical protein
MPSAGCGLRRFEAKTAQIHLFETKSHTRQLFPRSSVSMRRGKRAQCYHVAMGERQLAGGVLGRGEVDARNGSSVEWGLGSII